MCRLYADTNTTSFYVGYLSICRFWYQWGSPEINANEDTEGQLYRHMGIPWRYCMLGSRPPQ